MDRKELFRTVMVDVSGFSLSSACADYTLHLFPKQAMVLCLRVCFARGLSEEHTKIQDIQYEFGVKKKNPTLKTLQVCPTLPRGPHLMGCCAHRWQPCTSLCADRCDRCVWLDAMALRCREDSRSGMTLRLLWGWAAHPPRGYGALKSSGPGEQEVSSSGSRHTALGGK